MKFNVETMVDHDLSDISVDSVDGVTYHKNFLDYVPPEEEKSDDTLADKKAKLFNKKEVLIRTMMKKLIAGNLQEGFVMLKALTSSDTLAKKKLKSQLPAFTPFSLGVYKDTID